MPAISIVANFYNSEKYIDKLIKSVLAQTFTDWELIAVNDCSPGRDSEILHRWENKDSRIRVIDLQQNIGLARAKKVGIDAANGEYIAFTDGDDWFEKDALSTLYSSATNTGSDIVIMEYYRVYPLGVKRRISLCLDSSDYNRRIGQKEFLERFYNIWLGGTRLLSAYWSKFYKADKLKSFNFEFSSKEDTYAEDLDFTRHFLPTLDSVTFISYSGYNWRYGGISSMVKPYEYFKVDRILSTYSRRYEAALRLIDRYSVDQSRRSITHEAMEVLTEVLERFTYPLIKAKVGDQDIQEAIQKHLLNTQLCKERQIFESQTSNPLAVAIMHQDACAICDKMKKRYAEQWKTRLVRRILSFL